MAGKTVLITGATDGLGRMLAGRLGADGARVLVHGRDTGRAEEVRREILAAGGPEPLLLTADLGSLKEVDGLADAVLGALDRLDVLVSNAGVGFGAPEAGRQLSKDGVELRFAVNYLAGYRLTRRLLPLLRRSAPARVLNMASVGQQALDFDDLMLERAYDGVDAYRRSKLAQIMSAFDLAEELRGSGVTVNALHPASLMATTMVREAGWSTMSTVEDGAEAALQLIAGPEFADTTGEYFEGPHSPTPARAKPQAYDPEARARLRQATDRLLADAGRPPIED